MSKDSGASPYRDYLRRAAERAAQPLASTGAGPFGPVRRVGVIGCGTMGVGIALACLNAGLDVLLFDNSADAAEGAVKAIGRELQRAEAKGKLALPADDTIVLLSVADSLEEFADLDLVIEAVFENSAVKRQIFSDLARICRAGCILGTNTSTIDIDLIAAATSRPQHVIGLHFFSPANIMPLIEIVRGSATSQQVIASSLAFAKRIHKTAVVVGSCYGFAANRMGEGYIREAMRLLLEGASVAQVDRAIVDFGLPMGPCAMTDVVGIDVPYRARRENSQAAPEDHSYYRMADLLVEMGRHGQKTGLGFYRYDPGSRVPQPDPRVEELAVAEAMRLGIARRAIDDAEIVDRCILAIVNEGFRVVEEGIAERASDLDVIYTSGFGFPSWRGGPMAYAQERGLGEVLARIRELEALYGTHYWGAPANLIDCAQNGRSIIDPVLFEPAAA